MVDFTMMCASVLDRRLLGGRGGHLGTRLNERCFTPFFLVLQTGRFDINYPKVSGHKNPVLDIAWNPFNDNEIASASEDCTVKLWNIPDEGLVNNFTEDDAICSLAGHQRKVRVLIGTTEMLRVVLS